jgi:hypothetical protein
VSRAAQQISHAPLPESHHSRVALAPLAASASSTPAAILFLPSGTCRHGAGVASAPGTALAT